MSRSTNNSRLPAVPRLIRWLATVAALLLIIMTLLRAGTFAAFNRDGLVNVAQIPATFWLGFRFDAQIVAIAALPLLIIGTLRWTSPFNSKLARGVWIALLAFTGGVLAFVYVADFLHLRYLNQRLNASALGLLGNAKISGQMIWQTYPVLRIALGLIIAVAAAIVSLRWLLNRAAVTAETQSRQSHVLWFIGALLTCLVGGFGRIGQYPLRWSDAFNLRNDFAANLALNPVQSFASSMTFRKSGYDVTKVREHYPKISRYLGVENPDIERLVFERRVTPARPAAARPPNVVLVICESFSSYKSSMWGNSLDPTPFFNQLTRDGIFFDNCFTPHVGTARGVWATITGIPDVEPSETASRNPALVEQHTIIDDFEGYEKFYFLGGSTSWANIRGLITNNIQNLHLYEEGSYKSPRVDVWGISDKNLFLEANEVLRTQTKPFFAVIQTADNHRPYTIPKEDLGDFTKLDVPAAALAARGFASLAEFNAFRYTDYAFKKFFTAAQQAPYFDNTIFVFIGDHGIGGHAGTMFPSAWTEQNLTCYHVPLLFYAPKLVAPQRIHSVASMVDLLPTVAGLANIPYRNTTLGRDLLRQQEIDGGRSNAAFVIDHNNRSIGVIQGSYFSNHQRGGTREEFVWADFSRPAPAPIAADLSAVERGEHRVLAEALYESSRYLLLKNKRSDPAKGAD